MEHDALICIVGDGVRGRLLRLFVTNSDFVFIPSKLAQTLQIRLTNVTRALVQLERDGIIAKKKLTNRERKEESVKDVAGYLLNKRFSSLHLLQDLVEETLPAGKAGLIRKLIRVPGMKVIITTGEFREKEKKGKIDFLLAGSGVNDMMVRQLIRTTEKETGKELTYALLSVNNMAHRMQINDKFIRGIFDVPHSVHLDRTGLCS